MRRVILLGASNLTRGISTIVGASHRLWGRPLEIFAALGHGRSYGRRSTVLGRTLPSITHCGLWQALDARPPAETAALVTDIGNDLLYEARVERIVGWVERCLDALDARGARTVMTRLPLANIDALPEWRFRLLRRVMFPAGRSSLATIAERARALDAEIARIAAERGVTLVAQRGEWYGWDPIHIKLGSWSRAWHEVLAPWSDAALDAPPRAASLGRWLYLRSRVPAQRWWLGLEQRGRQPCGRLRDGTTISLY